ncbi:MAG: MotA/TolQ/ExbB proton channel family protein [Balneolales bacterium]|nr:MotA/TolQ/ExbB proton channel family protein [Balneolales bacterium]
MRTSILNILSFLISFVILIWGALLVIGFTEYNLIPSNLEFLNLPSLAIVFGGICASVFISYPFRSVISAFRQSLLLFSHSNITEELLESDVQRVMDWQKMIKQDKIRAVNDLSTQYADSFEGYLFSVLDTNYTVEDLRELGEINIEENYSRQMMVNQIISSMGKTSPVFGMLGTLFGLIVILSGFSEVESLLSGLGAALMTTLYGILIGNFVFTPMAKKMNNIASLKYFRERLILEGVILIEEQKTSLQIYDKLQAHMRRTKNQL